jgi:site-specific DNA-methyltransferase (adenine-specific)
MNDNWSGVVDPTPHSGRWPANVMHDGSAEVVDGFPDAEARFFYCAKASRTDRDEGCDHLPARSGADAVDREEGSAGTQSPRAGAGRTAGTVRNHHPTVKNVELMRYLCRLITPPGGTVLDPFTGSGSTGKGAVLESFAFVGIERESDYLQIAAARIAAALARAPQTAQKVNVPPVTPPAANGGTSILTETAPKATAKTQLSLLDSLDALDALDAL